MSLPPVIEEVVEDGPESASSDSEDLGLGDVYRLSTGEGEDGSPLAGRTTAQRILAVGGLSLNTTTSDKEDSGVDMNIPPLTSNSLT